MIFALQSSVKGYKDFKSTSYIKSKSSFLFTEKEIYKKLKYWLPINGNLISYVIIWL